MDLMVGKFDETSNFDVKYLAKRCWTNIIKGTKEILGVILLKADLKDLLKLSKIDCCNIENLIHPIDKQNFPTASSFLFRFVDSITTDISQHIPYKLYQIKNELKLLAAVYEGLLCLYSYVESSLSRQIQIISKAAYSLFHLFQMPKTNVPSQLYHDIQSTFIDCYVHCKITDQVPRFSSIFCP